MKKYFIVASLIILVILLSIVFLSNQKNRNSFSIAANQDTSPVAILYLDGSIIHFNCLSTSACYQDIDLGNQIKLANNPAEHPLYMISALHDNNSNLYLVLSGSIWNYLAKVNLETGKTQILDLNVLSTPTTNNPPTFFPKEAELIDGKVVVATTDGTLGIVQDDFSIKTIDLQHPIFDFIETSDSKIAIISGDNRLQNNKIHVKIFVVDVNSGKVEERAVEGPNESGWIVTVDQDIKHLYWIGTNNSLPDNVLHMFDIGAQKETTSRPILNTDAFAYTTLTSARYQYRNTWYYSRRCCLEGPSPALLVSMSTLDPVINPDQLLKDEKASTFMIAPFGNDFLLGTNSHVLVLSKDGKVKKLYPLPNDWIGRDYILLEYRK